MLKNSQFFNTKEKYVTFGMVLTNRKNKTQFKICFAWLVEPKLFGCRELATGMAVDPGLVFASWQTMAAGRWRLTLGIGGHPGIGNRT